MSAADTSPAEAPSARRDGHDAVIVARAALSRLMEPSDLVGLALVSCAGPVDALRIACGKVRAGVDLVREIEEVLAEHGVDGRERAGDAQGRGLQAALKRWAPRVSDLAPRRDLATIERLGGRLLCPEDAGWPAGLDDLGLGAPICLWMRGDPGRLVPQPGSCIAVVGSRDSTNYGASATGEIAGGLARRGYCVVSGGAYGIDALAHRAALACSDAPESLAASTPTSGWGEEAAPGPRGGGARGGGARPATISVTACGLDRYYPRGNEDLLREVARRGLLLAEVPPGSSPTRWRFLQRNRLIAALTSATVVVEARWRSGALNTAHHAQNLSREVGAVPGPIQSANSAGCHRLLREGSAVCVTDAAEVAELAAPLGQALAEEPDGPRALHDGLDLHDLLLLDALPVRGGSRPDKLASVAGLSTEIVLAGLGRLQLSGLAERVNDGWRKAPSSA